MSKKQPSGFIKYTGMGMSMIGPILAGYFGGMKIDELYETGTSWKTGLTLFGVFAGLYLALKDFIVPKND